MVAALKQVCRSASLMPLLAAAPAAAASVASAAAAAPAASPRLLASSTSPRLHSPFCLFVETLVSRSLPSQLLPLHLFEPSPRPSHRHSHAHRHPNPHRRPGGAVSRQTAEAMQLQLLTPSAQHHLHPYPDGRMSPVNTMQLRLHHLGVQKHPHSHPHPVVAMQLRPHYAATPGRSFADAASFRLQVCRGVERVQHARHGVQAHVDMICRWQLPEQHQQQQQQQQLRQQQLLHQVPNQRTQVRSAAAVAAKTEQHAWNFRRSTLVHFWIRPGASLSATAASCKMTALSAASSSVASRPPRKPADLRNVSNKASASQGVITTAMAKPEFAGVVVLEDGWEDSHDLQAIAETLTADASLLLKLALTGTLKDNDNGSSSSAGNDSSYPGQSTTNEGRNEEGKVEEEEGEEEGYDDLLEGAGRVELSVLLCSDECIREMNRKWRNQDKPTDVLSFSQDPIPGLSPLVLLGDIVISVETAERQARERGHSLLDELRVLLVHGLLHVLGYDHEEGVEAAEEMASEEGRLLRTMGWAGGVGLIDSATAPVDGESVTSQGQELNRGSEHDSVQAQSQSSTSSHRQKAPPRFRLLLCDMDGTLLNSKSKISPSTAEALRAAAARGVTVAVATGKARPAAMAALDTVGLAGRSGVINLQSPGVFIQGLRVYGNEGTVIHNALLPTHVVVQAFEFSRRHGTALIGFSGDCCVTMADHPLVEALHTIYYEPRAKVYDTVDTILNEAPIQKLLFYDTPDGIRDFIRPYWSEAVTGDLAAVTQAVPDMLEILPPGQSKGTGVQILLDSLGIPPSEVMALGDGENDKEMIELVGWGVAMANGSPATLSVADAIVSSNDDDGVAEAIEKYILS